MFYFGIFSRLLDRDQSYFINLQCHFGFVGLRQEGVYVMRTMDSALSLKKNTWVVLETINFICEDKPSKILTCYCKDGKKHRTSVLGTGERVAETAEDFEKREKREYCIHCRTAENLLHCGLVDTAAELDNTDQDGSDNNGDSDVVIDIICIEPFAAAVGNRDIGYGVIVPGKTKFKCSCQLGTSCIHMSTFIPWNEDNHAFKFDEQHEPIDVTDKFKSVSNTKIPWPLTEEQKQKYRTLRMGREKELHPDHSPEFCAHGYEMKKVLITDEAIVHAEDLASGGHQVFAYVSKGPRGKKCCSIQYDGSEHLLLNLDNKNLFCYGWLFSILCKTQETTFPLRAAHRSAIKLRQNVSSDSKETSYNHLYRAYNRFTR